MKKALKRLIFIIIGLFVTYYSLKTIRAFGVVDELTEIKTEHFVITYHGIYKDEAEEVARVLEASYERIRTNLDDPEHDIIQVGPD